MFGTKTISALLVAITLLFAQVGVCCGGDQPGDSPDYGNNSGASDGDRYQRSNHGPCHADGRSKCHTDRAHQPGTAAIDLGLIELDPATGEPVLDPDTGEPVVDDSQFGQPVEIDPIVVIPDETPAEEEPVHPIAALLASFFGEDGSVVEGFHDDGFGFGVIAQAMWMSQQV